MVKIIWTMLLGLSLLTPPQYDLHYLEITSIVYQKYQDLSYEYDGTYKIKYNNIILYENYEAEELSFVIHNKSIYVLFIKEERIEINKYSISGNLITKLVIKNVYTNLGIISFNDNLYLFGGIKTNDLEKLMTEEYDIFEEALFNNIKEKDYKDIDGIVINLKEDLTLQDVFLFNGSGDEYFDKAYIFGNDLYLTGKKEALSGYYYGMGGNDNASFIMQVDNDFKLIQRQIFNEKINNIDLIDDNLIVQTNMAIYVFNGLDSLILSRKLGFESSYSYASNNKLVLEIMDNKVYLYALDGLSLIGEYEIEGYDLETISDYIYLKRLDQYFILDVINQYDFYDLVNYRYYHQVELLTGLYGTYYLIDTEYDKYFDQLVYGEYEAIYKYRCLNQLDLELKASVIIEEEVNVNEGSIYPLGYHLLFSGIGYLNGELVYQNQEVSSLGLNELKLIGADGEERIINFIVEESQNDVKEELISNYDYVSSDNYYELIIDIGDLDSSQIGKLYINEENYDYEIEGNKIITKLPLEEGINAFLVNYLIVNEKEKVYFNYFFKVLRLYEDNLDCFINIEKEDDQTTIDINLGNANYLAKMIELKIWNNYEEKTYYYPLGDANIMVNDTEGEYDYSLSICFYNGSKSLNNLEIVKGKLSLPSAKMGIIKIIEKQEYVNEFKIVFENDNGIKSLETNDYYLELVKSDDYSILLISIIVSIFIGMIIIIFRIKRSRKHSKKI